MARPEHRVPGHILGLGYTCTCTLLVKLIKRLQNIILPDALFLYVGQPIKTREESNIPYLSVFPICSVLPLKGRPNIKLIDTCDSKFMVSRQLLSIHSLNLQLIRTFFIIKIWFLLVLVVMCIHSHQASDESCMQEMCSIFLQQHELILISTDVTAHARASAVLERIFSRPFWKSRPSCHFRTLTAYNKKTKRNCQKLISKPFSTCLNLSNKLNL